MVWLKWLVIVGSFMALRMERCLRDRMLWKLEVLLFRGRFLLRNCRLEDYDLSIV
jgi:hypothetical protein